MDPGRWSGSWRALRQLQWRDREGFAPSSLYPETSRMWAHCMRASRTLSRANSTAWANGQSCLASRIRYCYKHCGAASPRAWGFADSEESESDVSHLPVTRMRNLVLAIVG